MKRLLPVALVVCTLISAFTISSRAQSGVVSLGALDTTYTELFDTLAFTGTTGAALPAGWGFVESLANADSEYRISNGSTTNGDTYSFGATGSSERAFGGMQSGTLIPIFGAVFQNNTGSTITSLEIAYSGEHWRTGAASRVDRIDFQYSLDATSLTTGTWTDLDGLDFSSPPSTIGAKDGNAAPASLSGIISSISVAQGATVRIRWADLNASGADDGLAVDNFTIVARGVEDPLPALTVGNATVTEGDSGTTTATFNVSLSSSDHDGVDFTIETEDGTATAGDNDYQPRGDSFSIPTGTATFAFEVEVNGDVTFEPTETFSVRVSGVTGATVADDTGVGTITNDDAAPPVIADVVISQVYGGGGNSGATYTHDFIELYNQGASSIDLTGWSVQYAGANGTGTWTVTTIPSGTIAAGGYFLVQQAPGAGGTTPLPTPNASGTIAMSATAGKVALSTNATQLSGACPVGALDFVGYGGANCSETSPAPGLSNTTAGLRKRFGCIDSDNNSLDFGSGQPNPRNTGSPIQSCIFTFTPAAIHDIQGPGLVSPFAGQDVITSGIVTARKSNGFFLQAPDAAADADANSSEAIFVFTGVLPAVVVGDAVSARGTASEFFQLTQIDSSVPGDVSVTASGVALPAAVTLTSSHLNPAGPMTQLEHLEAMRVSAPSLTSVAPTDGFGEIGAVLTGVARPMREPGISVLAAVPPDPTDGTIEPDIPRFDENPERLFLDTEGLVGMPVVNVTSKTTITGASGPLDFTFGRYKLLPESPLTLSGGMSGVPVRDPLAGEFTVGGFNIEFFAGDETQKRKASLAILQLMKLPDVIGHVEIASLAALQALATQVNADALAATGTDPQYEARLIPFGTLTQHLGFLVKTSRVHIDDVTQELASETFNGDDLHDRPPLVLRATVDQAGLNPRKVVVVLNHTRSFVGIDEVAGDGPRIRGKRKAQAESIANLLQNLQTSNPGVLVTTIGDFNAYQFSDGYTDPIATLKGSPTADEFIVVDGSLDVVDPDFVNLTDSPLLPAGERYSFLFEGTPQALDHMLVNTTGAAWVTGYAIARGNSDFPDIPFYTADATRPEKASDHDMPVAYYTFPPPSTDVSVVKAADVASATTGQTVTFTITVTNHGTAPAQNVVVADSLPAGMTATTCAADNGGVCGGTPSNASVAFALLAPNTSATIVITAVAGCGAVDGSTLINTATVTSSTADPNTTNNVASASLTATNAAPVISGASASRTFLLPFHLMVPVRIDYTATDSCGPVTTTLSVASNEPVTGPLKVQGLAGLTSPDWIVVNNHEVKLRGERSLHGSGRVYTITITAKDAGGNTSTKQVFVVVPESIFGLFW